MGGGKKSAGGRAAEAANVGVDLGIEELRGFAEAGRGQLESLISGASVGGLGDRLAEIFSGGSLDALVDERTRATQGQLAAGGLTRSGTALQQISAIPQDIGLAIEQMLTGRSQGLAGQGLQAASGIGNLQVGRGQNVASGILGDAQASAQGLSNAIGLASGIFFSDPSLKTNVERVSTIGNLGVHRWDWIPEVEGTPITAWGNTGFMADEIKEKYPHHTAEVHGYLAVDYFALLDELQDKYGTPRDGGETWLH